MTSAQDHSFSALLCPKCNAVLHQAAGDVIRFGTAVFPDNLKGVYLIALGGAELLFCPVCNHAIDKPAVSLCFIREVNRGLWYIPEAATSIYHGDLVEQCRLSWQENGNDLSDLEIFFDSLTFRRKICHYVARLVVPLMNEYVIIKARSGLTKWIAENRSRLNHTFFSGLWLLAQKDLPVHIHKRAVDVGAEPPPVEECARSGVTSVEGAEQLSAREAQEMMVKNLHDLVIWKLVLLAAERAETQSLSSIPNEIENCLPSEAVDDGLINTVSEAFAKFGHDNPMLQYALNCILASVCMHGGCSNPHSSDWAEVYVLFEQLSQTQQLPNELRVTEEFASHTIGPRALWDLYAKWMSRLMNEDLDPQQIEWGKSIMATISDLVVKFKIEPQWAVYLRERIQVGFSSSSKEDLEGSLAYFRELFQSSPETLPIFFPAVQRELIKHDKPRWLTFMKQVREDAFLARRWKDAIEVTARFSEQWNRLGMSSAALQEVHACMASLREAGEWPPADAHALAMLSTEEANCYRYQGNLLKALHVYEFIRTRLPADLANSNVRVNERNLAIVMRDLGRVSESIEILEGLLQHCVEGEMIGVLHSIAVCHLIAGRYADSKKYLQLIQAKVTDQKLLTGEADLDAILTEVTLALREGEDAFAYERASKAGEIAAAHGDSVKIALAAGLAATALMRLPRSDGREIIVDEAIRLLSEVVDSASDNLNDRGIRHIFAILLWERGDVERAEQVIQQGLMPEEKDHTNQSWVSWLTLANLARVQGKAEVARQRLMIVYRLVTRDADRFAPAEDLVDFMRDKDSLQLMLCTTFLEAYRSGKADIGSLRMVADFQASLLLSKQLARAGESSRETTPLSSDLNIGQDGDETEKALETLAPNTCAGVAVLQFFRTEGELLLLVTSLPAKSIERAGEGAEWSTVLANWSASYEASIRLANEAWNRLARCSPARLQDPLEDFGDWQVFAAKLRLEVKKLVRPKQHLCFITGVLSTVPLQYIFGAEHPVSYAPSLAAAAALRRRAPSFKRGAWRPKALHDFVVWKANEDQGNINEFEQAAADLKTHVERLGLGYQASVGLEATQNALFAALAQCDCVRLSCHGRGDSRDLRFDLLVSCDGHLPPGHPTVLASQLGERFLVTWQELSLLPASSPLVFSAACASGLTASLLGGERIGLERSLLRAGTVCYVAPQWPVPIALIQPLVNRVIVAYLGEVEKTLSEVVLDVANAAIAKGVPIRVARSLAVHGDWI